MVLRPATDCTSTSPGRPPPLGEEDQRDALLLDDLEQAVFLWWLVLPWVPASTV